MEQLEKFKGGEKKNKECPNCHSKRTRRNGRGEAKYGSPQRYDCKDCLHRFSDKSNIIPSLSNVRQLCAKKKAKKLDTATETKTVVGEEHQRILETKGRILQLKVRLLPFEKALKNNGKEQTTIDSYRKRLLKIAEYSDINDLESVKEYITTLKADNTKGAYVVAVSAFMDFQGKSWKAPKYRVRSPIPEFLPYRTEIDQLVAGCGKKTGTEVQLISETGMRPGEVARIPWTALNDKDNILTINKPEKRGLPRQFKITPKLVMMLQGLPKINDKIFAGTSPKDAAGNYYHQRVTIAKKIGNPRLAKINFKLLRHWYGTMLYHETLDQNLVRRKLGHNSSASTEIYINMEQLMFNEVENKWNTKKAFNADEACKLLEAGFDYITGEYDDGGKIFRKRQ